MKRAILTLGSAIALFVGILLSPLAFMGIGYGSPRGYAVAAGTFVLIALGIVGVVRFYRRPS
jgi:hypothetical protein